MVMIPKRWVIFLTLNMAFAAIDRKGAQREQSCMSHTHKMKWEKKKYSSDFLRVSKYYGIHEINNP